MRQSILKKSIFNHLLCGSMTMILMLLSMNSVAKTSVDSGGISLNLTRIIFDHYDSMQTLEIRNSGVQTYLVQTKIVTESDSDEQAPFIATPPLIKLEAKQNYQIRLIKNNNYAFSTQNESIYYIKIVAIPMSNSEHDEDSNINVLMALRFTIKLFYRPALLSMPPNQAYCQLTFVQKNNQITITNPTSYYLTFAELSFDEREVNLDNAPAMIAPKSAQSYPVNKIINQIKWQNINDYGLPSAPCMAKIANTLE